jgi:hypothetical protein
MPSSYTSLLGFVQPTTGELTNTWGTTLNSQLTQLVEDAVATTSTNDITSADWTLSTTGGGQYNEARTAVLLVTGTPGTTRSIFAPKQSKAYILINKSNSSVVLKGGPVSPTTGATVTTGVTALVVWDSSTSDFVIAATGVTSIAGTSPVSASASTGAVTVSLASGYGDTQNPYASKTANFVLAAPNGTAGVPTFRAVVAADIPTLNQNTTGTASNVTGTVALANGGSGQTTAQAAMNAFAGAVTSGSYLRGNGTNVVMSTIQTADVPTLNQNTTGTASNVTGTVAVANGGTGQTTANAAFNALVPSQTSNSGKYLTTNGTNTSWATVSAGGGGTVTSVDVSGGTTGLTTSGGPVTSSGTITLAGTLAVANGGTGQTTYTNGQLLIGNTTGNTLTKATLTAGTGISVTNSTGSITIASTVTSLPGSQGQVFTSSGTFTIPTGITAVKVTVVGGGGAGGGGSAGGGGGGGGGSAIKYLTSLTPGNTLTVTVGAAGGTSSVASGTQSITTVSATGGSAGTVGSVNTAAAGGAGGVGSNGDLNIGGDGGNHGMYLASFCPALIVGGTGGSSILGGGAAGLTTGAGVAGRAYGGGGSGRADSGSGGAGAAGVVLIEW